MKELQKHKKMAEI